MSSKFDKLRPPIVKIASKIPEHYFGKGFKSNVQISKTIVIKVWPECCYVFEQDYQTWTV